MTRLLTLAAALAAFGLTAAHAQRTTAVTVANTPEDAVPVANEVSAPLNVTEAGTRIPVSCGVFVVSPTTFDDISCLRSDTGSTFGTVPAGFRFEVNNVVFNTNGLIAVTSTTPRTTSLWIGKASSVASPIITSPSITFRSQNFIDTESYLSAAPMLTLRAGDRLRASNSDSRPTGQTLNLYVSGYLVAL